MEVAVGQVMSIPQAAEGRLEGKGWEPKLRTWFSGETDSVI